MEQTVDQRQKAERAAEDAILKLKIAGQWLPGQWLPGEESGRSHDQTSSYGSVRIICHDLSLRTRGQTCYN